MVDAFARNGSLFLENGYDAYRSDALELQFSDLSNGQLAPQYPGGWGVLAAPAYLAGDLRGVMALNAVASALTLPMIWLAAEALFRDRRIAVVSTLIYALATFAVDYAVAVWPHAVTTFLVTTAVAPAAQGWRGDEQNEGRGFLLAGLAIGVAVNIRVDAILAAFALAAWMMGAAKRPYAALGMFALGLAPGLAAAAWINHEKFGRLSPITYGQRSGGASVSHYTGLLPIVAVLALGVLSLGIRRVRAAVLRPVGIVALLAAAGLAVLLVPSLGDLARRILRGGYALVVDFQTIPRGSGVVALGEQGMVTAWGLSKKALLESLPYAAAILVLAPRLVRGPDRAAIALCLLMVVSVVAFFSLNAWHGGASNSMRYFLNVVPPLAILSAVALREISALAGERSWPTLVALAGAVGGAVLFARWQGYPASFLVQHTLPLAIVIGLAALSAAIAVSRGTLRGAVARGMLGLFMLGLVTAGGIAWGLDLAASQQTRARNAAIAERVRDLPADALVVTEALEASGLRVNRPPALTAHVDFPSEGLDADLTRLVARAMSEGRPVFVQGRHVAERFLAAGHAARVEPRYGLPERFELYRLTPPGEEPAQ